MNEKTLFENKSGDFITRLKLLRVEALELGLGATSNLLVEVVATAQDERENRINKYNGKQGHSPEQN